MRAMSAGYQQLLAAVAAANPEGDLHVITDNLASHQSPPIQEWLAANPRVRQVFAGNCGCARRSASATEGNHCRFAGFIAGFDAQ